MFHTLEESPYLSWLWWRSGHVLDLKYRDLFP